MKILKNIITFLFIVSLLGAADTINTKFADLAPEPQHKKVTQLITHILSKNHYKKIALNDSLSSEIFDNYLEKLDYNRVHFLASDIASFEKYRYQLDDYLLAGQLQPVYEIFNIYQKRFDRRLGYIDKRIEENFNYQLDEYIKIQRDEEPWVATVTQLLLKQNS